MTSEECLETNLMKCSGSGAFYRISDTEEIGNDSSRTGKTGSGEDSMSTIKATLNVVTGTHTIVYAAWIRNKYPFDTLNLSPISENIYSRVCSFTPHSTIHAAFLVTIGAGASRTWWQIHTAPIVLPLALVFLPIIHKFRPYPPNASLTQLISSYLVLLDVNTRAITAHMYRMGEIHKIGLLWQKHHSAGDEAIAAAFDYLMLRRVM